MNCCFVTRVDRLTIELQYSTVSFLQMYFEYAEFELSCLNTVKPPHYKPIFERTQNYLVSRHVRGLALFMIYD